MPPYKYPEQLGPSARVWVDGGSGEAKEYATTYASDSSSPYPRHFPTSGPPGDVFLSDSQIDYNSSNRMTLTARFHLVPGADLNEVMEWLKAGPSQGYATKAADRILALVEKAEELEDALLKERKARRLAEDVVLQLRHRMEEALSAWGHPEAARELYIETVRQWSEKLVEGATFTAAEGEELVDTLVGMLQYIRMSVGVQRREEEEADPPPLPRKEPQALF